MKRMLWLLPLFFCLALNAQTSSRSFVIVNDGAVSNISDYERALTINDLDKYRHADHRTTMVFVEGVVVELLSAAELQALNISVDMSKVNTGSHDRLKRSQFTLHVSGRVIEMVSPAAKGQ